MIWQVLLALAVGILVGFSGLVPGTVSGNMDTLLMALLCVLLFIIGIDLSQNRNAIAEIRRVGARLLFIPLCIAAGSIFGALLISLLIDLKLSYGMAIGAGFGWYSLSSALLAPISGGEIGIMALLTNIFREILSIILLPLVVHYLGKTAAVAPGGATTMDTTLPFVVKYAGSEMSILSFVSGVILSLLVVFLVPALAGLLGNMLYLRHVRARERSPALARRFSTFHQFKLIFIIMKTILSLWYRKSLKGQVSCSYRWNDSARRRRSARKRYARAANAWSSPTSTPTG